MNSLKERKEERKKERKYYNEQRICEKKTVMKILKMKNKTFK